MWSPRRATTNRNQPKPCTRTEPSLSTRLARLSWLHWAHVTVGDLTAALLDGAGIVALFQLLWLSINGACKCVNFLLIIDHQWMVLSENYQPYWHCSTQVLAWHTVCLSIEMFQTSINISLLNDLISMKIPMQMIGSQSDMTKSFLIQHREIYYRDPFSWVT